LRVLLDFLHAIINDVINVVDDNPSGVGYSLTTSVAFDASCLVTGSLLGIGFRFGHGRPSAKELR
jgi:hypothetical protein